MKTATLRLEFAPGARRASRLGVSMLALSGAVLLACVAHTAGTLADNAREANALAQLEARRHAGVTAAKTASKSDPAEAARTKAVQQVAQNLVTPWADLLEALEAAPKAGVALLSIEPSTARHTVRITAEARDSQEMLNYLGALHRDVRLSGVALVSHEVQMQVPGTPVRFHIQAAWGPAP